MCFFRKKAAARKLRRELLSITLRFESTDTVDGWKNLYLDAERLNHPLVPRILERWDELAVSETVKAINIQDPIAIDFLIHNCIRAGRAYRRLRTYLNWNWTFRIQRVANHYEAFQLWQAAPTTELRDAVLDAWIENSYAVIDLIESAAEARMLAENPYIKVPEGYIQIILQYPEILEALKKRWEDLAQNEVREAQTVAELEAARSSAPPHGPAYQSAEMRIQERLTRRPLLRAANEK